MQKILPFLLLCHLTAAQQGSNVRVELQVLVNKLNIRAEPNTTSTVLEQLNRGDLVSYENEMSDDKETVTWHNKPTKGHWVKVTTFQQKKVVGWVFEFGVVPAYIHLDSIAQSSRNIEPSGTLLFENYWTTITHSDSLSFYGLNPPKILIESKDKTDYLKDSTLTFPLKNGQKKVYTNNYDENTDEGASHAYLGQLNTPNVYIIRQETFESWEIIFLNKTSGVEARTNITHNFCAGNSGIDTPCMPFYHFSPDHSMAVFEVSYDPGGMHGISFLPFKPTQTYSIAILDIGVPLEFRWVDNHSGIAKFSGGRYLKFVLNI